MLVPRKKVERRSMQQLINHEHQQATYVRGAPPLLLHLQVMPIELPGINSRSKEPKMARWAGSRPRPSHQGADSFG